MEVDYEKKLITIVDIGLTNTFHYVYDLYCGELLYIMDSVGYYWNGKHYKKGVYNLLWVKEVEELVNKHISKYEN
jgi:hypothetical protein